MKGACSQSLGQRPDAIVIGSGLDALGVIRSLGQGGLRVASISRSEHDPPQLSRFTSVRVQAPAAGTALLEAVRVLVAEAGPPVVVFLTEKETVQLPGGHQSEPPLRGDLSASDPRGLAIIARQVAV